MPALNEKQTMVMYKTYGSVELTPENSLSKATKTSQRLRAVTEGMGAGGPFLLDTPISTNHNTCTGFRTSLVDVCLQDVKNISDE